MKSFALDDRGHLAPAALAAVIACSPIYVTLPTQPGAAPARLPAGFDAVDVAILDWIAAEGRRLGRTFARF